MASHCDRNSEKKPQTERSTSTNIIVTTKKLVLILIQRILGQRPDPEAEFQRFIEVHVKRNILT